MTLAVVRSDAGPRLDGAGPLTDLANRFLSHLKARGFAAGTIRGYAYDLLNFGRFLGERGASLQPGLPRFLCVGRVVGS